MNVSARTNYIKQHMKHSVSTIIVMSTSTQYFKKVFAKDKHWNENGFKFYNPLSYFIKKNPLPFYIGLLNKFQLTIMRSSATFPVYPVYRLD